MDNEYHDVLKNCPLFDGIAESELRATLKCLSTTERNYEKSSFVNMANEAVTTIGIVLSGSVHIIQEDFWGGRTILARIERGGLFGEAFSCAGTEKMPVSVFAAEDSCILQIDYRRILTHCPSYCKARVDLIQNMLRILAKKNVMLTQKMEYITQRTTRERLLTYLSAQARQAGSSMFNIPFKRQELAEYLAVDRSAMSNELSKMRDDGLLRFHRNQFELLYDSQYKARQDLRAYLPSDEAKSGGAAAAQNRGGFVRQKDGADAALL